MTRTAHKAFRSEAELKAFLIRQSAQPTRKTFKGIQTRATAKKLYQAANR